MTITDAQRVCVKCGQTVVERGWFWVLPEELHQERVTMCPAGGTHEVNDDEADDDEADNDAAAEFRRAVLFDLEGASAGEELIIQALEAIRTNDLPRPAAAAILAAIDAATLRKHALDEQAGPIRLAHEADARTQP